MNLFVPPSFCAVLAKSNNCIANYQYPPQFSYLHKLETIIIRDQLENSTHIYINAQSLPPGFNYKSKNPEYQRSKAVICTHAYNYLYIIAQSLPP